ncbi:MAG: hypothetical protein SGJ09_10235 [Phycisphaerae bacterium]|nr:hypothetical protein [Phycisphaerae bacterium]
MLHLFRRLAVVNVGVILGVTVGVVLAGCSGPARVENPIAVLQTPERPGREYLEAMQVADRSARDPAYHAALKRIVVSPNYVVEARRAAFARLYELDREGLKSTLDLNLPKMEALEWRREVCEKLAEAKWTEMTPTLIRAWAVFIPGWADLGKERPERLALVALHGKDKIVDVLLDEMAKANPVTQSNLRARCWELLLLEGQEARLRALLADETAIGKDAMLLDLRAGVVELGVLPRTREEILWVRSLREPKRRQFWNEAVVAVGKLDASRRASLELRDVAIVTAAARHSPELLTISDADLDALIIARTGGDGRPVFSPDFTGHNGGNSDYFSERLQSQQTKLTFGDRLAMALAVEALRSPELRAHLFECADRDLADRSTEYGGVVGVDAKGRFEFVEYPSRTRANDARYEAPQELMDSLYTGLFHTHFHAQAYDNRQYAGPHMGDFQFADATRANCLVFAYIDSSRLNVDYYRYGRVVVDLGTIARP